MQPARAVTYEQLFLWFPDTRARSQARYQRGRNSFQGARNIFFREGGVNIYYGNSIVKFSKRVKIFLGVTTCPLPLTIQAS